MDILNREDARWYLWALCGLPEIPDGKVALSLSLEIPNGATQDGGVGCLPRGSCCGHNTGPTRSSACGWSVYVPWALQGIADNRNVRKPKE